HGGLAVRGVRPDVDTGDRMVTQQCIAEGEMIPEVLVGEIAQPDLRDRRSDHESRDRAAGRRAGPLPSDRHQGRWRSNSGAKERHRNTMVASGRPWRATLS